MPLELAKPFTSGPQGLSFLGCIVVLVGIFAAGTATAGALPTLAGVRPAATQDCRSRGSPTAMTACEEALYKTAINSMDHDLALVAKPFNRSQVHRSQLAWIGYLQADCATVFNFYSPGTIAPYEKAKCEVELTQDRIDELQPLVHPEAYS